MKIFDKFLRNGTVRRRAYPASKVMQIFHIRHFSGIRISLSRKKDSASVHTENFTVEFLYIIIYRYVRESRLFCSRAPLFSDDFSEKKSCFL